MSRGRSLSRSARRSQSRTPTACGDRELAALSVPLFDVVEEKEKEESVANRGSSTTARLHVTELHRIVRSGDNVRARRRREASPTLAANSSARR